MLDEDNDPTEVLRLIGDWQTFDKSHHATVFSLLKQNEVAAKHMAHGARLRAEPTAVQEEVFWLTRSASYCVARLILELLAEGGI